MDLKIEDLARLIREYSKYTSYWYDIGLQLGLKVHQLKTIEANNHHECGRCFCEMVTVWLQNESCSESYFKKVCVEVEVRHETQNQADNDSLNRADARAEGRKPERHTGRVAQPQEWVWLVMFTVVVALFSILVSLYVVKNGAPSISHPSLKDYTDIPNVIEQSLLGPIESAAKVLKSNYETLKITRITVGGITSVNYLGTVLMDKNRHRLEYTEFLNTITGTSTGRVILTGRAGSGKTTLMKHLATEWAKGRALQSCKIVFFVDLNELKEKIHSITELLSKSMFVPDLSQLKDIAHEITANKGKGSCFLLDDYTDLSKLTYVDSIMESSVIHSSFCLLSSRSNPNN